MENTVKLFYEDAFMAEFDATVLSCEPYKDGYKAVLDRTAFFLRVADNMEIPDILMKSGLQTQRERWNDIPYNRCTIRSWKSVHGKLGLGEEV